MESILIFTIKKGIFKADSVNMGLLYKDTVKASATFLIKLSQNTSDYNIDIILGDLIFMIFWANQSVSKETIHLYKIIVSKSVHVNGLSLFQTGISKNFSSRN